MFKKAELKFWDCTIQWMQKPKLRKAMRTLSVFNWETIKATAVAISGGVLGLLAAYLLQTGL